MQEAQTAEIRWWAESPEKLRSAFAVIPPFGLSGLEQESRTDHYLRLSGGQTGIKLREGLLEIKVKRSAQLIQEGQLEEYVKESHGTKLDYQVFKSDNLISVTKNRRLKLFDAHSKKWISTVEELKSGCSLEFAEVQISAETFYTICFEAFDAAQDNPRMILVELLKNLNSPPEMKRLSSISMGYAEFLHAGGRNKLKR